MTRSSDAVKNELQQLLKIGEFKVHERLPAEVEMAKRFSVSRVTYRNAVKELVEEGKLFVKHGSGTYVSKPLPSIASSLEHLESTGQMIRSSGFKEDERKESFTILSGEEIPEVCCSFGCPLDTQFIKLERYRLADDEPVSFSINYMPYNLVGNAFSNNQFSGSLFRFLEMYCSIEISCADSELFAVPNTDQILKQFEGFSQSGIMLLKQLHYSTSNEPVLYSFDYLRNDIFSFKIRRWRL